MAARSASLARKAITKSPERVIRSVNHVKAHLIGFKQLPYDPLQIVIAISKHPYSDHTKVNKYLLLKYIFIPKCLSINTRTLWFSCFYVLQFREHIYFYILIITSMFYFSALVKYCFIFIT